MNKQKEVKEIIVANTIEDVREKVNQWKKSGFSIGLVPTMGYLHEGHASLIKRAREENDKVIVSDFVNPIQFGPNEDLESYPKNFEGDCQLCQDMGADLIFHPTPEVMYDNPQTFVEVDLLTDKLCGEKRPGHFKGVCTVVSKLFNISKADRAYFGQKDAQQLFVIKKMVRDLNFDIEIVGCPIIREDDGLAKSSRNTYLSDEERKAALCVSKSIKIGTEEIHKGIKVSDLVSTMIKVIEAEPLAKIDYISVVETETLQPVDIVDGNVLVAAAVYIGKTRLIDNFIYQV